MRDAPVPALPAAPAPPRPARPPDARPSRLAALPVATALRAALRRGITLAHLRADLMAGLVVGVVAVPLSMALAIASGVPPQHGLYTAIVGGGVIALCGGSPLQVSGPTAAFVVILAPIAAQHGVGGLVLASLMAGGILLALGFGRLGRLIEFVPYPVTTGFTAGIAVVIATLQVKDLLGLEVEALPGHFLPRVAALARALPTFHPGDLVVGFTTLGLLVLWPKLVRSVPAPLAALTIGSLLAWGLGVAVPELAVATIGSQFHYTLDGITRGGIPPLPPLPLVPWHLPGPDGAPLDVSLALLQA